MKKIDEQIKWYEDNSNSLYDSMISIELEKINSLYNRYEDHADEMFVEEMIESFCKIIERQREKISDLETSNEAVVSGGNGSGRPRGFFNSKPQGQNFMSVQRLNTQDIPYDTEYEIFLLREEGVKDDKQLQSAFTQYCINNGTSSYTVNDYCSRIKKTWKSSDNDYRNGILDEELSAKFPEVPWVGVLMNVYDNIKILRKYVELKITETNGNRNWANARAALNKFDEFKKYVEE